jgi:hypothetical protein
MRHAAAYRNVPIVYPVPGDHRSLAGEARPAGRLVRTGDAAESVSCPAAPETLAPRSPSAWNLSEASRPYATERAVRHADAAAISLAAAIARVVPTLARIAGALTESGTAQVFGYARLSDYARERLGRSGRWVADLARLHACLERLPALRRAMAGQDGGPPLHASAALAVGGVATEADVEEWIAMARRLTLVRLRHVIHSGRGPVSAAMTAPGPHSGQDLQAGSSGATGAEPDPLDAGHGPRSDDDPAGPAASGDDEATSELRLLVPPLVRAAFRETLDLYRAVEGGEFSVTSFVEALTGESTGEPLDPKDATDESANVSGARIRHAHERDAMESALDGAACGRQQLAAGDGPAVPSWAVALTASSLARLQRIESTAGQGDAPALDGQMRELLALGSELELRLGDLLREMCHMGAWKRLGFADVGHYAERRLALSRTAAEDRVWVSRAVREHALIRMAYERGELGWEATRHILRVLKGRTADEPLQREWIERGRTATVKRLSDEVKTLQLQAALAEAPEAVEAAPEAAARAAPEAAANAPGVAMGTTAPHPMSDEAWHASLWREPGSTLKMMDSLGRALVRQIDPRTPPRRQSSRCVRDQVLRLRLPGDLARDLMHAIGRRSARLWRLAQPADPETVSGPGDRRSDTGGARSAIAGTPASLTITRIFSTRGERAPAWVGLLVMLEDFVRTWDTDGGRRRRRSRDQIFSRAGYRCAAPGCTSRRNLHLHHVQFRSQGGSDETANRESICAFHHLRGIHEGLASCRGEAPLGLTWRLGREDVAAEFINEIRVDPGTA